jgi:hypothetical protein
VRSSGSSQLASIRLTWLFSPSPPVPPSTLHHATGHFPNPLPLTSFSSNCATTSINCATLPQIAPPPSSVVPPFRQLRHRLHSLCYHSTNCATTISNAPPLYRIRRRPFQCATVPRYAPPLPAMRHRYPPIRQSATCRIIKCQRTLKSHLMRHRQSSCAPVYPQCTTAVPPWRRRFPHLRPSSSNAPSPIITSPYRSRIRSESLRPIPCSYLDTPYTC